MSNESCSFGPSSLFWTPLNPLTCHPFLPSQEKHVPISVTAQSTLGPGPSLSSHQDYHPSHVFSGPVCVDFSLWCLNLSSQHPLLWPRLQISASGIFLRSSPQELTLAPCEGQASPPGLCGLLAPPSLSDHCLTSSRHLLSSGDSLFCIDGHCFLLTNVSDLTIDVISRGKFSFFSRL